jgi:hypothetical protein
MNKWIFSIKIDIITLFLPVWLIWIVCFLLPEPFLNQNLPLWIWVLIVMGIDVSHVWSTIFRTYLDKGEFKRHQKVLIFTPIIIFVSLFVIASFSIIWFWRVMAYLALHHFIKQQYGFLAIYRAKSKLKLGKIFNDKWIIYFSMLYPVFYWHFANKRKFQWFHSGDFFNFFSFIKFNENTWHIFHILYVLIILAWLVEEIYYNHQNFAWGKNLWILTTAGNWFLGIVYFNSDIAFTLTNVVGHGIPYIVLVFFYVEKKKSLTQSKIYFWLTFKNIAFMFFIIILLAFLEEYCWDWLLNRQKSLFFNLFLNYPTHLIQNHYLQAFFFSLLSIPQVSHYIIDGYIWKNNKKNPYLKKILL